MVNITMRTLLAVAGTGTLLTLLAGCGNDSVRVDGEDVTNAEKALSAVTDAWQDQRESWGNYNLHTDARCYLAVDDDRELQETAYCGPIRFAATKEAQTWSALEVDGSGTEIDLESITLDEPYVVLPGDVTLTRPDGKQPPSDLKVEEPLAEALDGPTWASEVGGVKFDKADARIIGRAEGYHLVNVARVETNARINDSDYEDSSADTPVSGGEGNHLLVAELEYDQGALEESWDSSEFNDTLNLIVDGTTVAIPDVHTPESAEEEDTETGVASGPYLIAPVASDATEILLEMKSDDGVAQRLDLLNGGLPEGAPAVLYRENLSAEINQTFTLDFTLSNGNQYPGYYKDLTVQAVELGYWFGKEKASDPSKALLTFRHQEPDGGMGWSGPATQGELTFTADDGKVYEGRLIRSFHDWGEENIDYDLLDNNVVFEVPADVTGGTITFKPKTIRNTGLMSGMLLEFGDAKAEFKFTF